MNIPVFLMCIAIIAAGALSSLIPLLHGVMQRANTLKPIEYFPPQGASPIDIMCAYYGKRAKPRELFNPLMLYWAQRGFITVEEDCKRGLKLTKIKDICPPDKVYNLSTYSLEKQLFNHLFKNAESFYTLAAPAEFEEFYAKFMGNCQEKANDVSAAKSKAPMIICSAIAIISVVAVAIVSGIQSENPAAIVTVIFPVIAIVFVRFVGKEFTESKSSVGFIIYPFFAAWGGIPLIAGLWMLPPLNSAIMVTALIATSLNLFLFSKKIDIREKRNLETYGKIDAFKSFLLSAELDKLETLVEDDPEYFYEILPYCYILRITEKLKFKFDRIVMDGPAWYLGDLRNTLMF